MKSLLRPEVIVLLLLCYAFGIMLKVKKKMSSDIILILILLLVLIVSIAFVSLLWSYNGTILFQTLTIQSLIRFMDVKDIFL